MIIKPMPELVNRGRWQVNDTASSSDGASVNLDERMLRVPLGRDNKSRAIRNHEYFHIKWSPENKVLAKLSKGDIALNLAIKSIEDLRVNRLGELTEISVADAFTAREMATLLGTEWTDSKKGDGFMHACNWISCYGYEAQHDAKAFLAGKIAQLDSKILPILEDIEKLVLATPTFDTVLEQAKRLVEAFETTSSDTQEDIAGYRAKPDEYTTSAEMLITRYSDDLIPSLSESISKRATGGERNGVSGKMILLAPKLTKKIQESIQKGPRASDFGSTFRYAERYTSDKKMFPLKNRYNKKKVGTILIDVSGSMDINVSQLLKIMEHCRGVKVATYCGTGSEGFLDVIVKDGRMTEDIRRMGGGNIVDAPALRWLSKQKGPRVFVCDGRYTGIGDLDYQNITDECEEIQEKYRIKRIYDLDELELELELDKKKKAMKRAGRRNINL